MSFIHHLLLFFEFSLHFRQGSQQPEVKEATSTWTQLVAVGMDMTIQGNPSPYPTKNGKFSENLRSSKSAFFLKGGMLVPSTFIHDWSFQPTTKVNPLQE